LPRDLKTLDIGRSEYWDYSNLFKDYTCYEIKEGNDILNNELADNSFDFVMCNGMYEYATNTDKMISEIYRVLKQGGKAIFGFVGERYGYTGATGKKLHSLQAGKNELKDFKILEYKEWDKKYYIFICKK
jgi:ubiquinone/menaquinone biosynthesis C-methylase UbiE